MTKTWYVEQARPRQQPGVLELARDPEVSIPCAADRRGAWVQMWLWVSDPDHTEEKKHGEGEE